MQPKLPFPLVVFAIPLKHGDLRKRSWLCEIDGGYTLRLIASHMSRRYGEHSQSSPGPKPRPGRLPATICPPAQTPVLFSTSLTQLLARRILPATQNFPTPNPPKTMPTSTLPTSTHTSLNKLPSNDWVSVEFLHAPIPRKRSGSTTTINGAFVFRNSVLWQRGWLVQGTRQMGSVFWFQKLKT